MNIAELKLHLIKDLKFSTLKCDEESERSSTKEYDGKNYLWHASRVIFAKEYLELIAEG